MVFAVAAVAGFGFAVAATVALAVSALAVILVFDFDVALRTGAFLAGALLAGALLGDWERDFVVIGKSAYQYVLKFFAAFSSNLVLLVLLVRRISQAVRHDLLQHAILLAAFGGGEKALATHFDLALTVEDLFESMSPLLHVFVFEFVVSHRKGSEP